MKKWIITVAFLCAAVAARAGALKENLVPAETRWLLHVDGDALRKTRIGALVIDKKFEKHVRKLEHDAGTNFDFSFNKVGAVTIFGPKVGEDKNAVLILQTTADLRADLEKLIGIKESNGNGQPPISRISINGAELYTIGEDLNAMPAGPGVWVVGKSKTAVQDAREVALGGAPSLKRKSFLDYPAVTNSFFLLAVADTAAADKLPAQAKILQKAEGGRIVIGESGEKLFLNLALRSKDSDAVKQIQQVIQGLISFIALTQAENKDLVTLANSASVSSAEDLISVNLSFPLPRAMEKAREEE